MNTSLLKCLVSLSGNQVDVIDTNAFFEKYSRETYSSELYSLERMGFITLLNANNKIKEIAVNKKAIDYVAKL